MKKHLAGLVFTCVLLSAIGCVHRQGSNKAVTRYEQVMIWNDALAQTNDHIARGIIEVSPSLVAPEIAAIILREQKTIALIDEQLTSILKQGPDSAKLNSANLQALLNQIRQSAKNLTDSGAAGIKNPTTQQTFDAEIQAVGDLVDDMLSGLRLAGVIQ